MEKAKLAELVMQKMKEKKQQQQRNRPHFEVLRLQATFANEQNTNLKRQIADLQSQLHRETEFLKRLTSSMQELDNTGKKVFPRIVVKPQFIASENVKAATKEFYRKSSNSFLKSDLLKIKDYEHSMLNQAAIMETLQSIRSMEVSQREEIDAQTKIINQKRVKVLKQDLRLRSIKEDQRQIQKQIQQDQFKNRQILREYEIKKVNLSNRVDHLQSVKKQIEAYKQKIESAYNPKAYREHLKNVFNIRTQNEMMEKNLSAMILKVNNIQKQTQNYERVLQRSASLLVYGRTGDSPSRRLGSIQKRMEKQKQKEEGLMNYYSNQMSNKKSRRSVSENQIMKTKTQGEDQKEKHMLSSTFASTRASLKASSKRSPISTFASNQKRIFD